MLQFLDVEKVIEQSHVHGANFEVWEHNRKFLADAIDHDGTMLDIGCANGFLLRCLQEWTGKKLDPYGIDTNAELIEQAHVIFPQQQDHFRRAEMLELKDRVPKGFPEQFEYVLWCVWDEILKQEWNARLKVMIEAARKRVAIGGRLILMAYHADPQVNEHFGEKLRAHGYECSTLENELMHPERAYLIEKSA